MPPAHIELTDLRKVYPARGADVVALDGIDLAVPRGAIHGIVGRSGAGKSTLIRCLTVLERPTSGTVTIDGDVLSDLPEARLRTARRRIGMVFQHVNLLDSRTIAANVGYPLEVAGMPRTRRAARVAELLDLVGLGDRGDAYPAQLSGGQKQRVGIARALATEPAVLLCDEPTSALDSATTRQILGLIRELRDRLGITVLLITHEMAVVREICDSVTLLEHGRVVESGPVGDVVAVYGSRLARELIPVPELPLGEERSLVEVAYTTDDVATRDVLAAVAGLGAGVEIAAGTIETLAGRRVGRLQLDLPAGDVDAALARLHAAGVRGGDPMTLWDDLLANRVITELLPEATLETLQMVAVSSVLTVLLGLPLGVLLHATSPGGLTPQPSIASVVGFVVNVGRSLPFVILMIAVIPFTRWVVGTSLGWEAAVVPLTLGAVPFFARLVESALREVSPGKVEAARVMGSTRRKILGSVLVREALPALVSAATVTVVSLISFSAMAGVIGGGGLGALAISYGYQRFDTAVMVACIVVIVVVVQAIQIAGDALARRVDHR